MIINIICVGKIREKYIEDGIKEFTKRLSSYISLDIKEISAAPIKQISDELKARQIEAEKILNYVSKDDYNIVLAVLGKELSSEELAIKFDELSKSGVSKINLIIGGATGLDEKIINMADFKLSFSKMTFPHQLMRLILLEQLYRAFKIIHKEPYHK